MCLHVYVAIRVSSSEPCRRAEYDARYQGVCSDGSMFQAAIVYNGRNFALGQYEAELEAAQVVDEAYVFQGLTAIHWSD